MIILQVLLNPRHHQIAIQQRSIIIQRLAAIRRSVLQIQHLHSPLRSLIQQLRSHKPHTHILIKEKPSIDERYHVRQNRDLARRFRFVVVLPISALLCDFADDLTRCFD